MDRVMVIGCPGAGKSTFSRELARVTGLPLIHLDAHYHVDTWPTEPEEKRAAWRAFLAEIVKGERWIIDGNYKNSFDIRMPVADTIIYLDYPTRICLFRLFRRQQLYRNRRRPDMPPNWKEKISWDLLHFVVTFRRRERDRILALLDEHRAGRDVYVVGHPDSSTRLITALRTADCLNKST
jgi:adenylate kinase family enzyme